MSLHLPVIRPAPVSTPSGRVEMSDIRSKLEEIRGEVNETTEQAKPTLTYALIVAVLVLVGLAFLMGRKRGKSKSTWIEISRL
jgi:CHASE3 domain sensor protein